MNLAKGVSPFATVFLLQRLDYVVKAGGLRKAAEYDGTCPVASLGGLIPNYRQVEPDSEEALRQQVFKGPVAVALQADQLEMQLYMSGDTLSPAEH